jgi:hypothetical protein
LTHIWQSWPWCTSRVTSSDSDSLEIGITRAVCAAVSFCSLPQLTCMRFPRTSSPLLQLQSLGKPLHAPLPDLLYFGDSPTANVSPPTAHRLHCNPRPTTRSCRWKSHLESLPSVPSSQNSPGHLARLSVGFTAPPQTTCAVHAGVMGNTQAVQRKGARGEALAVRRTWVTEWLLGRRGRSKTDIRGWVYEQECATGAWQWSALVRPATQS